MKKVLLITLAIFALLGFFSFSAKATVTTGDAYACQDVNNSIFTGNTNFMSWYNNNCVTPTVTPIPTQTPTVTPSVTVTPTPTTTDPCANGGCQTPPGGSGDGRSDGLSDGRSSCPSCTQAPATQAVLGLSTTSSDQNGALQIAGLLVAFVLSVTGFALYKKNA
jgi:hypothetical protein